MGQFGVGQPVPREEDPYLLRGAGRYVDDVILPREARGYVLRSPHAHARIVSLDAGKAKAAPGVLLVLTGQDPEIKALGTQYLRIPRKRRDGSPAFVCPQKVLQPDRVRFVGDTVAFVVAETLAQAKDAAELIEIEYEPLPAVIGTADAVKPGAPAVWDELPGNECYYHAAGDKAAVEAAFAKAAHVVKHHMVINRITANSMEPRGCLAHYDTHEDRYVVRCTIQAPHRIRWILSQMYFKVPEQKFQVIAENVGGGFGMKGACYPEYALTALAARLSNRPVKWIAERSEGLISDEQARDNVTDAELALDKDGKFIGLRVSTISNAGAYHNSDRNSGPAIANIGVLAGTYTTPAIFVEVRGVLTNTQLTSHYRGAGRPEAAYVIETLVDLAARKLAIDPVELRRRNTIPSNAMPYKTALVYTYDSGDFAKNLNDCLGYAEYAGLQARIAESKARGKLRGIGISNTIEASAGGMLEAAQLRFDPSGGVTLLMGTHDHGQGHATTFKQIIADKLGLDHGQIRYKNGDTDQVTIGIGTFGSRSAACGGTAAVLAADKVIAKGAKIAAHVLEAAETDIAFENGKFTVAGTDRAISLVDVAKTAYLPGKLPKGLEMGLDETGIYDGGQMTFPNGCHVAEVEIDQTTGVVEIVRYSVVDDVGRMINPMLVKGQVHGGIAQGVGQALMEDLTIDPDSGQIVSGSFMDYAMPRADNFCNFEVHGNEVPTPNNPLGVKGAGEAGTVGALSAVMNAINDALARAGAPYVQMPATAEKVWRALSAANGG